MAYFTFVNILNSILKVSRHRAVFIIEATAAVGGAKPYLNKKLSKLAFWLSFKKIELAESIRYSSGDPIKSWLHALLCLYVTSYISSISRFELCYITPAGRFPDCLFIYLYIYLLGK